MDAVVRGKAVAEVLQDGAARRPGDQPEPGDDQALVEDLHEEDLLLERVRLERHVRQVVKVRIPFRCAARLPDELQPRLRMA